MNRDDWGKDHGSLVNPRIGSLLFRFIKKAFIDSISSLPLISSSFSCWHIPWQSVHLPDIRKIAAFEVLPFESSSLL